MSDKESNRLIERVDALLRRKEETQHDVPVLTEVVEPDLAAVATHPDVRREALAADLERALIARLVPELERRFTVLRVELEREMRRAVREAVAHVLAGRTQPPPKA